jgi:hypothetical protein
MIPGIYNIKQQYKGDTFQGVEFQIVDSDTKVPVDLTSTDMRCQFRKGSPTGLVVKDISLGFGIAIVDALTGKFKIDSFDINWAAGMYYYDIPITFSAELVKTYIKGTLTVIQDVTTPNV